MPIDLQNLTIVKAHEALKKGEFTSVELTQAYLDQIAARNGDIYAYLEVFEDAIDQAKEADKKIQGLISPTAGLTPPVAGLKEGKIERLKDSDTAADFPMLLGIPCAIKDNILIKGHIASSASKILERYHATYDATVIRKLKEAGAVFLGRTNMDEFAMGGSTENSAYGPTRNPHDLERVPGGTSGGSAAVVAADMALFALGSDTGGSIRQPSSFCGVVGIKPTYGNVSRYGLMAAVSSFDQIGPIVKTVEDAEIVFDVIKGKDEKDGTSQNSPASAPLREASAGKQFPIPNSQFQHRQDRLRIGIPKHFLKGDGIDPAVVKAFESSVEALKAKGYEVIDIELPNISYSLPAYYILNFAEISSNMARYDGMRFGLHVDGADGIGDYFETRKAGLGKEVIRRILLGTYVLSSGYYDAYYNRANAVRRMITEDFTKAFQSVDVIATPTTPSPAFKLGEKTSDPVAMYLEDIFTVTANLTGMPAISVPMKTDGLPVGIQFTAPQGGESALFEIGKETEIVE